VNGARQVSALATFALLALQWLWSWAAGAHAHLSFWVQPSLFSLPLLPPAIAFLLGRPRAPLWAGIVALLYFCHGIAELRVGDGAWPWLEIALSLAMVLAAGWPGLATKLAKRRTAPPPNV
jgi:uncharacterized membrane protein